MFVEFIYIYEQYNPETARRNTPKLKHFIPIEKTKHLNGIDNLGLVVPIATLFNFSVTLKISLRFYLFLLIHIIFIIFYYI